MTTISGANNSVSSTQSRSEPSSKAADSKDSDDFSNAMDKKEKSGQKKANEQKDKSPDELMRSLKDKDAVGMEGKTDQVSAMRADTAAIQKTNAAESIDKVNKIVDRIMLAEAGSAKEVKVSFNQDFLAGTDVTIRKDAGKLSVEFNTTSSDSFNFLSKGEQALTQQLQNKLGDNVSVNINMQSGAEQQQDGRSKNEYFTGEDKEEE